MSARSKDIAIKSTDRPARQWNNIGEICWFYGQRTASRPDRRAALDREMQREVAAFYASRPPIVAYKPPLFGEEFWQWVQIIGFFLFIAFVIVNSEDSPLSYSEYVAAAARQMAGSAQRCREGEAISCALLRMQVEEVLYGSGAERCIYGDGDYESCQDAAYELLEKKGSTG